MKEIAKTYTESSLTSFLITVVAMILFAFFALFAFGLFPFNTWLKSEQDVIGIQTNTSLSIDSSSL